MVVVVGGVSGVARLSPLRAAFRSRFQWVRRVAVPVNPVVEGLAAILAFGGEWSVRAFSAAPRHGTLSELFLAEFQSAFKTLAIFRVVVLSKDHHEHVLKVVHGHLVSFVLFHLNSLSDARHNTLCEVWLLAAFLAFLAFAFLASFFLFAFLLLLKSPQGRAPPAKGRRARVGITQC